MNNTVESSAPTELDAEQQAAETARLNALGAELLAAIQAGDREKMNGLLADGAPRIRFTDASHRLFYPYSAAAASLDPNLFADFLRAFPADELKRLGDHLLGGCIDTGLMRNARVLLNMGVTPGHGTFIKALRTGDLDLVSTIYNARPTHEDGAKASWIRVRSGGKTAIAEAKTVNILSWLLEQDAAEMKQYAAQPLPEKESDRQAFLRHAKTTALDDGQGIAEAAPLSFFLGANRADLALRCLASPHIKLGAGKVHPLFALADLNPSDQLTCLNAILNAMDLQLPENANPVEFYIGRKCADLVSHLLCVPQFFEQANGQRAHLYELARDPKTRQALHNRGLEKPHKAVFVARHIRRHPKKYAALAAFLALTGWGAAKAFGAQNVAVSFDSTITDTTQRQPVDPRMAPQRELGR